MITSSNTSTIGADIGSSELGRYLVAGVIDLYGARTVPAEAVYLRCLCNCRRLSGSFALLFFQV